MKKILSIAALIGLVAFIMQKAKQDRERWQGLTEDEVRDQLDHRLPNQIPDDKRQAIADTVVTKMRDRGALSDDLLDGDDTIDLAEGAETIDDISEAASA